MKTSLALVFVVFFTVGCWEQSNSVFDKSEQIKSADGVLNSLASNGFEGSVLIACSDQLVFKGDFGLEATDKVIRYDVASISKWLTATAVLKLVELGKLELDDRLVKFFPTVPADKSDITLFHLLTHQSGLKQNYAAEGHSKIDSAASSIFVTETAFKAGTGFAYSNDNYSLLAMVIEKVSGASYTEFVNEVIAKPLELEAISFWPESIRDNELFPVLLNPRETPDAEIDRGFLGGHGARLSVSELHAILVGLESGALLSAESLTLLHGPHLVRPSGMGIGMGWYTNIDELGRELASTRGSDSTGGNAVVYIVGSNGLTVIAATNNGPDESDGEGWSRQVRDAMIDIFSASGDQEGFCAQGI